MKKLLTICLVITATFVLAACSVNKNDTTVQKPEQLQTITLGILPDVDSIPFIIAQEKGFFREQGLTVKLQSFKSAMDRDSALQSGNLDGAVSDILAAAFAKEGGFSTVITSLTNGSYKLIIHKDVSAASIKDLKGKDVGISKNTIIEYVTDKMLTEAGLTSGDINKAIIPQMPARLEMLKNGKIAAATLPEPLATIAVNNGAKILNSSDKLGVNPGVLLFTAKSTKEKSKEIQAMYQAYNKAVDYLSREPAANYIDLLIEKGGFPKEVKGNIVLPAYTKATAPAPKEIESVVEWLQTKQLIKKAYTYQDLVDTGFVR
ncbi:ABC transporter substrate-binding protein [Anaerosporomusa subterranea]|uniref:ABC transporter substrate-binding protein n=1 Tax=Anaerosporomusa subterranea TaxID=1794912 RepID=A0A154BP29_ANASB|nr:MetQ/NlpA family ABC transporter substrate-binding protein [Anaerosporomusa subterranea]KYZ75649.1 ABC transporter substrate-binding protein [Anaerosporomusa subterranea]